MKKYRFASLIAVLLCCCCYSCSDDQEGTDVETTIEVPVEPGTFESFLNLFEKTDGFQSWGRLVIDSMGGDNGVYSAKEVQDKTLRDNYEEIGPEFLHFISTDSIVNQDPKFSEDIKDPISAFQFWATFKHKLQDAWLVCVFALKKEWVDKKSHSEFHAHPVLLLTYSDSGELIDQLRWTYMIDDMEQIYNDIDVIGDTLISGYSPGYGKQIEEVYFKTVISQDGKFDQVLRTVFPERENI